MSVLYRVNAVGFGPGIQLVALKIHEERQLEDCVARWWCDYQKFSMPRSTIKREYFACHPADVASSNPSRLIQEDTESMRRDDATVEFLKMSRPPWVRDRPKFDNPAIHSEIHGVKPLSQIYRDMIHTDYSTKHTSAISGFPDVQAKETVYTP